MRNAIVLVLLMLAAVAPACAQQAPPQIIFIQEKNPAAAGLFSFLIPGAGQVYNGQAGKGVFFLGSAIGLLWLGSDTEEGSTSSTLYGVAYIGNWVWSIVDGVRTAKRMNAEERTKVQPTVGADGRVGLSVTVPIR